MPHKTRVLPFVLKVGNYTAKKKCGKVEFKAALIEKAVCRLYFW